TGERGSGPSTPRLSSMVAAVAAAAAGGKDSPRGSATGSVEEFGSDGRPGGLERGSSSSSFVDTSSAAPAIGGGGGGGGGSSSALALADASEARNNGGGGGSGIVRGTGSSLLGNGNSVQVSGGGGGGGGGGELPACLVGILDSFFGGNSKGGGALPPHSPSTITGIDVEVGRSAFAMLGVRDLDDIKHLSGAGIIAPESPERFCHLSDEVVVAAAAVLSSAVRSNAPSEGFGLASAAAAAAAAAQQSSAAMVTAASSTTAPTAARGQGFSKQKGGAAAAAAIADMSDGISRLALANAPSSDVSAAGVSRQIKANGAVPSSLTVAGGRAGLSSLGAAAAASGGVDGGGGGCGGHNALKTVRITGTAEEVQLAEYLIRVRTAGRDIAAA
ncbi:unnamed protein product, partial [Laminaria digitata]